MTQRTPFLIIPWDADFLPPFKDAIVHATQGQPGEATVVFMHDRPRRYLANLFRTAPNVRRPCLLPHMLTTRELFSTLRLEQDLAENERTLEQSFEIPLARNTEAQDKTGVANPTSVDRREIGLADQVALLYACVRELAADDTELCSRLSTGSEADFFPWGVRLTALMEECFTQALEPDDLAYTENEVAPFGAALLASLGRIFHSYRQRLEDKSLITPGFEAWLAASRLSDKTLPRFLTRGPVFLAGFNALSGTEDKVFHFLWERGARVCLHLDGAVHHRKEGATVHWSCTDQVRWLDEWGAATELLRPPSGKKPDLRFFAGYDLHSQLHALREDLTEQAPGFLPEQLPEPTTKPFAEHASEYSVTGAEQKSGSAPSTAVVLAHAGILLPVLHHLPAKDCNISLGYPLDRSLLFRLLEAILELRDQTRPDGSVRWKALIRLIRHPYLRMLRSGDAALREVCRETERQLRTGSRFVQPRVATGQALATVAAAPERFAFSSASFDPSSDAASVAFSGGASPTQAEQALLDRVLRSAIENWTSSQTLGQTGRALSELCQTLLECGETIWKRFPLDAECLFRLMQRVIPALSDNALADVKLPWGLLKAMLLELAGAERVPFEADPLTGLQVLGMLETRLLRFDRVFVLDVTDDHLPGAPSRNPLLPDSLRKVLGLPDTRAREQLAAYTFHRLLACADQVNLYWQEGVECAGLFDGKKQRSRLVEELVWREEKKLGRLLRPGEAPLRTESPRVRPPERRRRSVLRTPAIQAKVDGLLKSSCSSSLLDAYLVCPLRFYYERLCRLKPEETVVEEDDPAAVGELVHAVLRKFYTPWEGQSVRLTDLSEQSLVDLFMDELKDTPLPESLPPESSAMLAAAGPERLVRYLRHQPDCTEILHLESRFEADIDVCGRPRHLAGFLDRVDRRDGDVIILDYKTGRLKNWSAQVKKDEELWSALSLAVNSQEHSPLIADPAHDLLPRLAGRIPSLQLAYYMYLYSQATGVQVRDAAYVGLGLDGEEHPLIGDLPEDAPERLLLENGIPDLLRFMLLHLERCPEFRPREGRHCDWCLFYNLCIL